MNIEDELIGKVKKWVKDTNIVDVDESDFYNPLGWKNGYLVHKKREEELRDYFLKKHLIKSGKKILLKNNKTRNKRIIV
ncbi:hypothetical protein [Tenacibaculum maritimum]|uniref:hypothetical protein n=1 Tax=Tenacibaculum maritimum TaxID=107401 RepID=UPI0012E68F63|nr:hypothetical protein [Tenacibaculum maritimum]MCD9563102.1 hypothetical protein [Tenacibaculum maritimum]MCD9567122.1 hypothetical protein [Tenacibaculum maritimum]MCD9579909.1 hypothetical protein [Tenacibaculum maritimum]MCD9597288.1 hypothetical protein [Tenacibaculum maritimum]MCD9614486.1 hypothetical protein [Tenacibaculum maritimum]